MPERAMSREEAAAQGWEAAFLLSNGFHDQAVAAFTAHIAASS